MPTSKTLKTSPAFAAGILNEKMTIEDIVLLTEKYHENSN